MNMNPVLCLLKTLFLFISHRVTFIKEDRNKQIVMEDGKTFRVFRHVRIQDRTLDEPAAAFVVRFRPRNMTVAQNVRFSILPMLILLGFRGFREKYWCVNDETGLCQGVYAWQTTEDAENYSKSIAMRFMSNRSDPGSVSFRIVNQERDKYWLFQ